MHRLKEAPKKVIGFKQSLKAIERGTAVIVYVARDSADKIRLSLMELCAQQEVPVVEAETMLELGKICGIQVGASVAAILKDKG
ncbi:MAG TPA: 50S ribosomal protein L7Ae-like protein [Clostridia bacterium]|jgi:large subunit ribosomal protein L7A|nr:ribosomal L7Ae/L30e/S12e/Gadd45 family protein [Clostridia bacterium]HHY06806.1 50S ribosomal protein L7Ae-like protein [Clostridia bacterium]